MRFALFILFFIGLALLWKVTPLADYATPETISPLLDDVRNSDYGDLAALGIYTLGTLLFFPHIVMTMAMVLVFPPVQSVPIVLLGSLLSGAIGYGIGRKLGHRSLRFLTGNVAEKISGFARNSGLLGLTLLRMVPAGPFNAVNIVLGMSRAPFPAFLGATLLGLLPGTFIGAFLGHSLTQSGETPSEKTMVHIAIAVAGWLLIVGLAHYFSRLWQKKHTSQISA